MKKGSTTMKESTALEDLLEEEPEASSVSAEELTVEEFADVPSKGEESSPPPPGQYFQIESRELVYFMQALRGLRLAKDTMSRSVLFSYERGKVVLRATDADVFMELSVPCKNSENVLKDDVVLPVETILGLLRARDFYFTIYKVNSAYFARVMGGEVFLEVYAIEKNKFLVPRAQKEDKEVSAESFLTVISSMSTMLLPSLTPQERRIFFTPEGVYVNCAWAIVKVLEGYPRFDLKVRDTVVLKSLLRYSKGNVKICTSKDGMRKEIRGDNFFYSFYVSSFKIGDMVKKLTDTVDMQRGISIAKDPFMRVINLSRELPHMQGKLSLSNDSSGLNVELQSKRTGGGSNIQLMGTLGENYSVTSETSVVHSDNLSTVLACFSTQTLSVELASAGVILTSPEPGMVAVLYKEI